MSSLIALLQDGLIDLFVGSVSHHELRWTEG